LVADVVSICVANMRKLCVSYNIPSNGIITVATLKNLGTGVRSCLLDELANPLECGLMDYRSTEVR
jgi:hypothetical protein